MRLSVTRLCCPVWALGPQYAPATQVPKLEMSPGHRQTSLLKQLKAAIRRRIGLLCVAPESRITPTVEDRF